MAPISTNVSSNKATAMLPKLEELILLAVLKHGPETTAGDVQATLTSTLGREQSFGAVFTTMDRLATKKFVTWKKGNPDPSRGGRAPRLYTITGVGRAALIDSLRATNELASGTALDGAFPSGARG